MVGCRTWGGLLTTSESYGLVDGGEVSLPQSNVAYALLTFAMSVGAMFTGVMCDTVVVETSMRYEVKDDKGQIQTASRRIIAEIWVAFSSNLSENLGGPQVPRMTIIGPLFAIALFSFEVQKAIMVQLGWTGPAPAK